MFQDFEATMVEEEDAEYSDAEDEEEFEIEVLFDFTKLGKKDISVQDAMVNKEDNEVFRLDNVLSVIVDINGCVSNRIG